MVKGAERMRATKNEIEKQLEFCKTLSNRLEITGQDTVLVADIKRLRRELMELVHMTKWDYKN